MSDLQCGRWEGDFNSLLPPRQQTPGSTCMHDDISRAGQPHTLYPAILSLHAKPLKERMWLCRRDGERLCTVVLEPYKRLLRRHLIHRLASFA